MVMKIEIPIKIPSLANMNTGWRAKYKVRKVQKNAVKLLMSPRVSQIGNPPYQIVLTRISPRFLDSDNLVAAFKNIVDSVSEVIHPGLLPGRADGLGDIFFEFRQEKGSKCALTIEFL